MRRLLAITAVVMIAMIAATVHAASAYIAHPHTICAGATTGVASCGGGCTPTVGYSWGYDRHYAMPAAPNGVLSASIRDNDATVTGTGDHSDGWIGFQNTTSGHPWVQAGIREDNGGTIRFYAEEEGAPTPPPGWQKANNGDSYAYYWNYNGPVKDMWYSMAIYHTGTDTYVISGPGYSSPSIYDPNISEHPETDVTGEQDYGGTSGICVIDSFSFTNLSPYSASSYQATYSGTQQPPFGIFITGTYSVDINN